jgi:polysaccharide export outer membrane protein
MKKLVSSVLVALTMLLVLGSCGSTKNVAYFQNADSISLAASRMLYEAKIMPKDELTITVITTDPKAAMPFNLSVSQTLGTGGQLSYGSGSLQGYLVDNDGNIEFPVVGTLHVGGLTKKQAEDLIKNKVKPYLAEKENPIVTVRMGSYHVSVLGEVEKPGIIYAPQEKMSILEALAQCGDLTIYGKRDNVLLIRQIRLHLILDEIFSLFLGQTTDMQGTNNRKLNITIIINQISLQGTTTITQLSACTQCLRDREVERHGSLWICCNYCNCKFVLRHNLGFIKHS